MNPIAGTGILTAAAMRAAEDRAIAAGATVDSLMQTAGHAVAAAAAAPSKQALVAAYRAKLKAELPREDFTAVIGAVVACTCVFL